MWYFDSSAILGALLQQKNSDSIRELLSQGICTSRLSRVEVFRSISRIAPELRDASDGFFARCVLIEMERVFLTRAEEYSQEITLKSADAIHVATVEFLRPMLFGLVTLDKQMILNAKRLGINVLDPAS
jgi:predicted nucleic acid-binding protein